jgi:[acyl-carrier-protein] S-malonyltransferase
VISGEVAAVKEAAERLSEAGARRAIVLEVGGAFHSPLMAPAGERLQKAIEQTDFEEPSVPIYQNVTATPERDPEVIKQNLVAQLTSPVRWTQTMRQMIADGTTGFVEVGGKGRILAGMVKRLDRSIPTESV